MRKIINSAFISLDGVTEDPRSWATFDPGPGQEAAQALQALSGMLMGRGAYEYFADAMPQQTGPYADAINAIRTYMFSSTLESADWNNCTIIRADVVAAVTKITHRHDPIADRRSDAHLRAYRQLNAETPTATSPPGLNYPRTEVKGRRGRYPELQRSPPLPWERHHPRIDVGEARSLPPRHSRKAIPNAPSRGPEHLAGDRFRAPAARPRTAASATDDVSTEAV